MVKYNYKLNHLSHRINNTQRINNKEVYTYSVKYLINSASSKIDADHLLEKSLEQLRRYKNLLNGNKS